MKRTTPEQPGLGSGRQWGAIADEENILEWTVDRQNGLVQGPLDLGFLRGRRVLVALEPGQMALLVADNRLQAVYLDGGHILEIGNGKRQVPTTSCLVFLAADQELRLRWTKLDPVQGKGLPATGAIGHCSLAVDGPASFYDTFLAGTTAWDEQSLLRAVDAAARRALEEMLEGCAGLSESELQTRLTELDAEQLSEFLAEYGLRCNQIAVYTATPPTELDEGARAGQFGPLVHN